MHARGVGYDHLPSAANECQECMVTEHGSDHGRSMSSEAYHALNLFTMHRPPASTNMPQAGQHGTKAAPSCPSGAVIISGTSSPCPPHCAQGALEAPINL